MKEIQEKMGKDVFEQLREEGNLLSITNNHNGKNCPRDKQLLKCNLDTVTCMQWGPIGHWDTLDSGVLRLESDVCELAFYKTNGLKIQCKFSKGDLRYVDGNWMTMYIAKKPDYSMCK